MDLGQPASYLVLGEGTPVYASGGEPVGEVTHVLAAEAEDVFDGIVIRTHVGPGGHRFVDADDVGDIYERGVVLKLDRGQAARLPEPSANPAVMYDDPADRGRGLLSEKLKRAWDHLSGNP
jgi:uncharacterized protein YrrD